MADFTIKQNDTLPTLTAQVVTVQDGSETVFDLTDGSTVVFSMKRLSSDGTVMVDNGAATFFDAANGKVRYSWNEADTALLGKYTGEFKIIKNDGSQLSPPILSKLIIEVVERSN